MTIAAIDPKRRALGKGLDSLLPRVQTPAAAAETEGGKPREIPLDQIDRNPFQTRSRVNEELLAELAASIVSNGVVQPVLVRPLANGRYQLIAGERRWLASQLAGKETIPAILRQVSDEQAMEITIVENLQRADLNPMEQARAFERLSREFHMTQEQMAQRTGKDRATVANFLRLLRLPATVRSGSLDFRFLFAKQRITSRVSCTPKRPRKKIPGPSPPSTPTSAKSRTGFSAPSASRFTSKTTTAAAKSSSNTPAWKTSTPSSSSSPGTKVCDKQAGFSADSPPDRLFDGLPFRPPLNPARVLRRHKSKPPGYWLRRVFRNVDIS